MSHRRLIVFCLGLLMLGGCVTIPDDFKNPGVSVVSVTPRGSSGIFPEFDIVLHVTNPNRTALDIAGLSYTVHLEGNKVLEGVANDFPQIAPYGEADVSLEATADLLGGLSFLGDLLTSPGSQVTYEFNAEIDLGTLYPIVSVKRSGVVSLR